ncbi:MAG: ATP-grasp domain-containing protein [bacterium]|nr:ATP-grasp domain-containing protein [bacterium]
MKIEAVEQFHMHNIYSERPVFRFQLNVSIEEASKRNVEQIGKRLRSTLVAALGTVDDGPTEWDIGSLVAWVATFLQRSLGVELETARPIGDEHSPVAVFEYEDPEVGLLAGRLAFRLTRRLGRVRNSRIRRELRVQIGEFHRQASAMTLPIQDREVMRAARKRGIEVLPLAHRLFQLGQGRFRQRIYGSSTSRLTHLSSVFSANKHIAKQLLIGAGLPVARSELVRGHRQAIAAANRIGYPVVIKPNKGSLGRGVSIGVRDAKEAVAACKIAQKQGRGILVEELIGGKDHRLLVINGKAVAASMRIPAHVEGDGRSTIRELAAAANDDPRRRSGQQGAWTALTIDDAAIRVLERQGVAPDSIPQAGTHIDLRAVANTSSGGTAVDITDEIHPENLRVAERAAIALGTDIAGVDILSMDLSRPLSESGGVICEINTKPGLRKHIWPAVGKPRDVIGPLLDMLFPARENESFRTVTIVAQENEEPVIQIVRRFLELTGHTIATSNPQASTTPRAGSHDPVAAARRAFLDPVADGAVLQTTPDALMAHGLGYSRCSVGVLIGAFRASEDVPAEYRTNALQLLASATHGTLVIDADEPDGLDLASQTQLPKCFVLNNPSPMTVRSHLDRGVELLVTATPSEVAEGTTTASSQADISIYRDGRVERISTRDLASVEPLLETSPRQAAFAIAILLSLEMSSTEIGECLRRARGRQRE